MSRVKEIDKVLEDLKEIFEQASEKRGWDSYYNEVHGIEECYNDEYSSSTGATKICYIPSSEDIGYVLKVPFTGNFDSSILDEDEIIDSEDAGASYYEPFCHADSCFYDNYCEAEVRCYEMAEEAGFGKYFAKTEYYCTIGVVPIYIQEKVLCLEDVKYSSEKRLSKRYSNESFEKAHHKRSSLDTEWVATFIEFYGEEEFDNFESYIETHDISDLHSGNIGFRMNGEPVLLDYSGYWD